MQADQMREDAKQAREVASKTREYAKVGDWRREAWKTDTEWFDRLASYAEECARVRNIVAERLAPAEARLRAAKLRLQENEYRYAETELLIDRRDEVRNAETTVAELTALLAEWQADEGGAG